MPKVSDLSTATPDNANDSLVLLDASDTTDSAQGTLKRAAPDAFGWLPLSGGTLTGALTLDADPTLALHAATKQYVDAHSDSNAIHDNVSGEISAVAEKATPVDADLLLIEDSAASNAKKRVQIGNLPTGASALDDLSDVSVPSPTDAQVLTWVDANGQWEAADAAGGGGASDVDDLTTDTGNATEMVRVDGAGTGLEYRTPAQVLADIGAAASGHDHDSDYVELAGDTMTGNLVVDGSSATLDMFNTAQNVPAIRFSLNTSFGGAHPYIGLHPGDDRDLVIATKRGRLRLENLSNGSVLDMQATGSWSVPTGFGFSKAQTLISWETIGGQDALRVQSRNLLTISSFGANLGATAQQIDFYTNDTKVAAFDGQGRFAIGPSLPSPFGALIHINQSSTTGAIPVITLEQDDVSEEFIEFIGQSAADDSQSLVDAADLTTPGSIIGWLKISVQDEAGTGPIADGTYFIPFYSAPTA